MAIREADTRPGAEIDRELKLPVGARPIPIVNACDKGENPVGIAGIRIELQSPLDGGSLPVHSPLLRARRDVAQFDFRRRDSQKRASERRVYRCRLMV